MESFVNIVRRAAMASEQQQQQQSSSDGDSNNDAIDIQGKYRQNVARAIALVKKLCDKLLVRASDETIDSQDKFHMSQLLGEVAILGKHLDKLTTIAHAAGNQSVVVSEDENAWMDLMAHWLQLAQLVTKLLLLLAYFGTVLKVPIELVAEELVAAGIDAGLARAMANGAEVAAFLSNSEVRSFWANNFGATERTCPLKAFLSSVEAEWEVNDVLSDEGVMSSFSQQVCSIPSVVSIFRLDDFIQSLGLVTALTIRRNNLPSTETLSTEIAALTSSTNLAAISEPAALTKLQKKIDGLLTIQEEQVKLVNSKQANYMLLLAPLGDSPQTSTIKEIIAKNHKLRLASEQAAQMQLQQLYQATLKRSNDVLQQQQQQQQKSSETLAADASRDELTENGKVLPPHSIIMKSKNFTEVYESVRKDTVSGKVGLEFEDLIRKLNENVTEPVPKPDAALVKQFKVAPTDKFLFACPIKYNAPNVLLPSLGVLYIYDHSLCFQRTFFQEQGVVVVQLVKIQRPVKTRNNFPPFFDSAIQLQMQDKSTLMLQAIDQRDLVFELLQLLLKHNTLKDAHAPDTLMDLGLIVTEDAYENERFVPLRGWLPASGEFERPQFSDEEGNPKLKDKKKAPKGSKWTSKWQIDMSLTDADKEGWEYAVGFKMAWGPMSATSFVRRRRWVRQRVRLPADFDTPSRVPQLGRELEIFSDDGVSQGKITL